jgi:hypothetical protein
MSRYFYYYYYYYYDRHEARRPLNVEAQRRGVGAYGQ